MSVTIEQALRLPSLRRAEVAGGAGGLDKPVLSVSVLECSETSEELDYLYQNIDHAEGELAITSFYGIRNNVELQLETMKKLAGIGIVGLVLYYVGIVVPGIDDRLVRLADSMDFPLICMPPDDSNIRYSETISEVMEAVIKDQMNEKNYSMELLAQMSKLSEEQRTVDSMLYLVSNRLHVTVVLTDAEKHLLAMAAWPRSNKPDWKELKKHVPESGQTYRSFLFGNHITHVYREDMNDGPESNFSLFMFSESKTIETLLWHQAADGISMGMSLWGKNHDRMGLRELVRAIIKDEPIKMRRIADLYHINISEINDMLIVHSIKNDNLSSYRNEILNISADYAQIKMCEPYENDILLFYTGQPVLSDLENWSLAVEEYFRAIDKDVCITRCNNLQDTTDVKNAYYSNQAYIADARTVFNNKNVFSLPEIEFIKSCRIITDSGEESIERYLSSLRWLAESKDGDALIETLTSYFLDNKTNISETAKSLFVHKNTIKYRLRKISNILGIRIGEMPGSQNILYAVAIWRLLKK